MIPETIRQKFLLFALVAAIVTIPLANNLNSIATIVFVGAALLSQPFSATVKTLRLSGFWMIPVIYFIWTASSYFWDTSGSFTVKELERYAILLFIPASMAMLPKFPARYIRTGCIFFIITTAVICILCLVKAYIEYGVTGDYRVFYYQYLGEQMSLNAIFLSNYCLASITWLLYYGFVERGSKKISGIITALAGVTFFLFMIFLLSSKLIIFLTLLIIIIFVLTLGYLRGFFLRSLLILVLLGAAGVFAVNNLSYLRWRITSTEIKTYSGEADNQNGLAIRLFMWKTAIDLIKERPVLGYGLKGARVTLLKAYGDKGFEMGVRKNYHSHNQYLETTLMAGVPALLILLWFLFASIRMAIAGRNFLLTLMIFHFMIQSLFEATFEVQHELVFYIFFIFLFYYHAPGFTKIQPHNNFE